MAKLLGFSLGEIATPVKYVGTGGDFGAPGAVTDGWQQVAGRNKAPVRTVPISAEEQVKAGIDTPTDARTVFFKLNPDGTPPFTERDTLDISSGDTLSGKRYNVRVVTVYDQPGFPKAGEGLLVRL